ncbi:MAG: RNA polymerase subunit sigma-24, partial [Chloroflexota bacterium]|nr:RNA polymerase subunit sigma-24 [Chloroflexota bacterium]
RQSGADDEAVLLSLRDSSPPVLDQVVARLDGETVRSAIDSLPPLQRQAISNAYLEGRSHAEIAATTGLPLGTVHGRIRLGMRRMKAQLLAVGLETPAPG